MHRSRLAGILIDTPAAQSAAAAGFWSAALGVAARPAPGEEQFTVLSGAVPGIFTVIQAVDDAPRYHLDIETDDLAAEVARLTALGAEPVSR
jgi:Glyoxalase-like domain